VSDRRSAELDQRLAAWEAQRALEAGGAPPAPATDDLEARTQELDARERALQERELELRARELDVREQTLDDE
jgi:hypothetical protein